MRIFFSLPTINIGNFGEGGISGPIGGLQFQQQSSPARVGTTGFGMAASGQPSFGSSPAFGGASSMGGTGTYVLYRSIYFYCHCMVYRYFILSAVGCLIMQLIVGKESKG